MMRSLVVRSLVWTAALVALVLSPRLGHAQAYATNGQVSATPSVRTVTVRFKNTPLADAVQTIADQSDVMVAFSRAKLPDRRVTYEATHVSAEEALGAILVGTAFRVERFRDGSLKLVPGATQADGVVVGKVTHAKTRQAVAGATVTVDDATKGVLTSDDGTFRLSLPAGLHTIHIRGIGFAKQSRQVRVQEGQTATADVVLEPSTSVLNEVVVTGTVVATERKAIPTPITVISAEDIEKRGITRIDQLFRGEVPGLLVAERGVKAYGESVIMNVKPGQMVSSTMYSRGSADLDGGANPIKTYVDGVELTDPSYLGTIDPKSIERIEIITGPQAATIYGSGAMGGVMQIFTKKGIGRSTPELVLSLKYGMLESNLSSGRAPSHNDGLTLTGGGPAFSYSGNLSYVYSGPWQPFMYTRVYGASIGGTLTQGPVNASASFSTTATQNGTYETGFGTIRNIEMIQSGDFMTMNYAMYYSQRTMQSANQTAAINFDYRPFRIWQHHVTLGKSQNRFDLVPKLPSYDNPDDSLFQTSSSTGDRISYGYNMTFTPSFGDALSSTLTLGGNGSSGRENRFSGCLPASSATEYVPCMSWMPVSVTKTVDDKSWGGFGSWQLGFFSRLYLTLGLRGEYNPRYGKDHRIDWTPTQGLTYTAEIGDVTMKFLGSYGRATRPPRPDMRREVYYQSTFWEPSTFLGQLASTDLTPEYSRGPQGGVEVYVGNRGSFTVNRYIQTISGLLYSVKVDSIFLSAPSIPGYTYWSGIYQWRNIAKVRQHGWEGTGSLNLGPLTFKGTYTWADSYILSSPSPWYYRGKKFWSVPSHYSNISVGYAHGGTSVLLTTNYVGAQTQYFGSAKWVAEDGNRLDMYRARKSLGDAINEWPQAGYAKSDLAVSQRVKPWASLTLNVLNLGNNFGSEVGADQATLGRQTSFGVTLRYP